MKLLNYVRRLLPLPVKVSVVGDWEFGHPLLVENLRFWGWDYALQQPGEPRPWYLATNWLDPHATLRLYHRRMWIEEMFGDMKKHGFDLEASHLRHFLRLSRLTLAVCLLYLWLVALSEYVITHRLVHEIDRTDHRDLSLFRLGWDFLERRLTLFDPIPNVAVPNVCLMLGGWSRSS